MFRIPRRIDQLVPQPATAVTQIGKQAAGVIVHAIGSKYIPNPWARWGAYVVAAGMGIWYPITRATLVATKLDQEIESL